MTCSELQGSLAEYAEGGLSVQHRSEVEKHLDSCTLCTRRYELLLECYDYIRQEKITEPDPFMYTRIMAIMEEKQKVQPVSGDHRILRPVIITVLAVMFVITGIKLGLSFDHNKTLAIDYKNELYYLNEVQSEYSSSLILTEKQE